MDMAITTYPECVECGCKHEPDTNIAVFDELANRYGERGFTWERFDKQDRKDDFFVAHLTDQLISKFINSLGIYRCEFCGQASDGYYCCESCYIRLGD